MKVASFTTAGTASYGIVTDKGVIDGGKRLKAYPTLKALLAKGSLDELNQVRNHVSIHRASKGQNDTIGRPSLRLRHGRGMQPLLEQRNEGDGTFARHLFAIVDEWPIMSYERNDASYGNVAWLPR